MLGVKVTRGYLWSNYKNFKPGKFIYQNEALTHVIWKRIIFRGLDPKSGVFRVIAGQSLKIFKPGQIIDQNEAIGRVDTKNGFRGHPRSLDKERSTNYLERSERSRIRDLSTNSLERSERLRRRERPTNCPERSERIRRKTG